MLHGLFRRHLGKAEILAAPGDALFFPGDIEYRTSHPQDGGDHGIGIRVDPGTLDEIWGRARHRTVDSDRLLSARALVSARAILRLRQLVASVEEDGSLEVEETALLLLGKVAGGMVASASGSCVRADTRRAHEKAVERVMEVVQTRLHEKLRLSEIAREAAYSPYHLCRVFKEQTGMTIHGYVNRQRLMEALDSRIPEKSWGQLAAELGFASHSHLSSTFKRHFGRPPSRLCADNLPVS